MGALANPDNLSETDEMIIEIATICEKMIMKYGDDAIVGLYIDSHRNPKKPLITDISTFKISYNHQYDLIAAKDILEWLEKNADKFEDLEFNE